MSRITPKVLAKHTVEFFRDWAADDAHDGNEEITRAAMSNSPKELLKEFNRANSFEYHASTALNNLLEDAGEAQLDTDDDFSPEIARVELGWTKADFNLFLKECKRQIIIHHKSISKTIISNANENTMNDILGGDDDDGDW